MLSFLFGKKQCNQVQQIRNYYQKLKELYNPENVPEERKIYLRELIEKFGYLPYPFVKALDELTEEEVLFSIEVKWALNGVFKDGNICFENGCLSPVKRAKYTNANWIKQEQHEIKLINLAATGDGTKSHEVGKFVDWLRQIVILPSGNKEKGILSTTIYLLPFHPRDFGCSYLPISSDISNILEDKKLKAAGIQGIEQIKAFVAFAQLAGHPVIYDVLPQTGRFSKIVLAKPFLVRWFDVNELINEITGALEEISIKLKSEFDEDDVEIIKTIYKNTLKSGSDDLNENFKALYDRFSEELKDYKKIISDSMLKKQKQIRLQARVRDIVAKIHSTSSKKITCEADITKQGETIQALIKEGLWSSPGGAWCSAGVPVFEKMSECGSYPIFSHYDYQGKDVTQFANLDCQTPFYFVFLETGEYNRPVIDFYISELENIQKTYNFDGIRVDHIDHVVDELSELNHKPISYRAPRMLLKKMNKVLKDHNPHFAILAEYMMGGNFLAEYHSDMGFDILWGNDILTQYLKTPEKIIEDNRQLQEYNSNLSGIERLSVIKTYNNQDGEFRAIDQYPGQLGEAGALFKWFKLKFIPGGKLATRPVLYIDGDESFTKTGMEGTILAEVALPRERNYEFFNKFDALRRLAISIEQTTGGESEIITSEDDGFICYMISKDPLKESLLVVANYLPPTEKISIQKEDGKMETTFVEGETVFDKKVKLPCDYNVVSEFVYNPGEKSYLEEERVFENDLLTFEKLEPSEFRIFKIRR